MDIFKMDEMFDEVLKFMYNVSEVSMEEYMRMVEMFNRIDEIIVNEMNKEN